MTYYTDDDDPYAFLSRQRNDRIRSEKTTTADKLEDIIFSKEDLKGLKDRPFFKIAYMVTAIAIVLLTMFMMALGFGLWGDKQLNEENRDAYNATIMLSFLAAPVGILFFMALQSIHDSLGLFTIIVGYAAYVALYFVRLTRSLA